MNYNSAFIRSAKNARKAVAPIGIAIVLLALPACAGQPVPNTPSASSTATASESLKASPIAASLAGSKINGLSTKTELANDGKGVYIQTTVSDDDPAMQYKSSVVTPDATAAYSEAEIKEAQQFIVRFIAEEGLDSAINGSPQDDGVINAWWESNKDKFDPEYQGDIHKNLIAKDPFYMLVFNNPSRDYSLAYGEDKTHVHSRSIIPASIKADMVNGIQYLSFYYDTMAEYNVADESTRHREAVKGSMIFSLKKDKTTGKWLISGYKNTFTITESLVK